LFTSFGSFSGNKKKRKGDADVLGLGINLYMRTLKFFALLFGLFTLLTIPNMLIFINGGNQYQNHPVAIQSFFARSTLGNLGSPSEISTVGIEVTPSQNLAAFVTLGCQDERKVMTDLLDFGLAFKNHSMVGLGLNQTVKLLERCSLGHFSDVRVE
jgi:hypothetical protein